MALPIIEVDTTRLRLRQWQPVDNEAFARLSADPRVMEFFPSRLTRAESDAMVEKCKSLITLRGWGFWAVEEKVSAAFLGLVGLHVPSPDLPFSPCVEVGWRLGFDYWGKGYATEAAAAALDVGFNRLQLTDIVSFTSILNLRSQKVMEKLGMQREAGTFMHPTMPAGSGLQEHCLYRITSQTWQK